MNYFYFSLFLKYVKVPAATSHRDLGFCHSPRSSCSRYHHPTLQRSEICLPTTGSKKRELFSSPTSKLQNMFSESCPYKILGFLSAIRRYT